MESGDYDNYNTQLLTNNFKGDLNIQYIKNGSFFPILDLKPTESQYFKNNYLDIFNGRPEDWELNMDKILRFMKPIISVRNRIGGKSHYYEIAFRRCV